MLYLAILWIGIVLVVLATRETSSCHFEDPWFVKVIGTILIVVIIFIYIITVIEVYPLPEKLKAQQMALRLQWSYMQKPPVDSELLHKSQDFWKNLADYNRVVMFWKHHPDLDAIIWLFPRVSDRITKLEILEIVPP